jgi:hypothetical protein
MLTAVLLLQSGCATAMLSETISQDHKRLYVHHVDEDRVYKLNSAAVNERGDIRIHYTGAHGPDYDTRSYQMTLRSEKLSSISSAAPATAPPSKPRIQLWVVSRRATRKGVQPDAGPDWTPLPVHTADAPGGLDLQALAAQARAENDRIHILYSQTWRNRTPDSDRDAGSPVSTGLGILFVPEKPEEPSLLVLPCVPPKSTHDFSGLGMRCLYPFAIVWDVATFPVQAGVMVWVLQDASGGWLF